jgi:uroporphyrinogen decarboxylase
METSLLTCKPGTDALAPHNDKEEHVKKIWDFYNMAPGAPLYRKEFGYYCIDEWHAQGLPHDADFEKEFFFDKPAIFTLEGLGWCEAAFYPGFEEKILEDRGEHEVIQDMAGRHVLMFKGRRNGFMPEYLDHPVKDWKTWEENVKWRLDPKTTGRYSGLEKDMNDASKAADRGMLISQNVVGGYMYLRSLLGPEQLFYAFYDMPDVVHACMEAWLKLADAVTAKHQERVTLDQLFLAEDICYNHGSLISIDMIKEFLFPYYQQLIKNIKSRQIDRDKHLFVKIDTDGFAEPIIQPYHQALGMDVMEPFEVASGCDVVELGKKYPWLRMAGGIDKRVLAKGRQDIDEMLERILPAMKKRGGYFPTCDHGVPTEVSLENYRYYRKRCVELGE